MCCLYHNASDYIDRFKFHFPQDASSSAMDGMSDCMLKSNPQDPGVKAAALTMMQGSAKLLQANMIRAVSIDN